MNMLKYKTKKTARNQLIIQNPMSAKTKDFIQKICYRRTASVDMTRYGFISDSKTHPISLMMKPLQNKLKTICEKDKKNKCKKTSQNGCLPRTKRQSRQNVLKAKTKEPQNPLAKDTSIESDKISSMSKSGDTAAKTKEFRS